MLIYEKENKLNINFDNEVSGQPDLQISKEDGKTSVTIDGQPSGGGSGGGATIINAIGPGSDANFYIDATWQELYDRMASGEIMYVKWPDVDGYGGQTANSIHMIKSIFPPGVQSNGYTVYAGGGYDTISFHTDSSDGNPAVYYD